MMTFAIASPLWAALMFWVIAALVRRRQVVTRATTWDPDRLQAEREAAAELQAIEYAAGLPVPPPVLGTPAPESSRGFLTIPTDLDDPDEFARELIDGMTRALQDTARNMAPLILRQGAYSLSLQETVALHGPHSPEAVRLIRPTPPPSRPDSAAGSYRRRPPNTGRTERH